MEKTEEEIVKVGDFIDEVVETAVWNVRLDCILALMYTFGIDHSNACKLLRFDEEEVSRYLDSCGVEDAAEYFGSGVEGVVS